MMLIQSAPRSPTQNLYPAQARGDKIDLDEVKARRNSVRMTAGLFLKSYLVGIAVNSLCDDASFLQIADNPADLGF